MISNLPVGWDMEFDLVAIGSGIGGLGAAITAHDHGASAVVLERADQLGGVTAISLGECWIPGNHLEAELGIDSDEHIHPTVVGAERHGGSLRKNIARRDLCE